MCDIADFQNLHPILSNVADFFKALPPLSCLTNSQKVLEIGFDQPPGSCVCYADSILLRYDARNASNLRPPHPDMFAHIRSHTVYMQEQRQEGCSLCQTNDLIMAPVLQDPVTRQEFQGLFERHGEISNIVNGYLPKRGKIYGPLNYHEILEPRSLGPYQPYNSRSFSRLTIEPKESLSYTAQTSSKGRSPSLRTTRKILPTGSFARPTGVVAEGCIFYLLSSFPFPFPSLPSWNQTVGNELALLPFDDSIELFIFQEVFLPRRGYLVKYGK